MWQKKLSVPRSDGRHPIPNFTSRLFRVQLGIISGPVQTSFLCFNHFRLYRWQLAWSWLLVTRPSPKAGPSVEIRTVCFLVGVTNRHSWDADWSQVGNLGRWLKLTQINSERNFIAKHKSPDSQKLNTRRRGENFKACQEQRHVYLTHLTFGLRYI